MIVPSSSDTTPPVRIHIHSLTLCILSPGLGVVEESLPARRVSWLDSSGHDEGVAGLNNVLDQHQFSVIELNQRTLLTFTSHNWVMNPLLNLDSCFFTIITDITRDEANIDNNGQEASVHDVHQDTTDTEIVVVKNGEECTVSAGKSSRPYILP